MPAGKYSNYNSYFNNHNITPSIYTKTRALAEWADDSKQRRDNSQRIHVRIS